MARRDSDEHYVLDLCDELIGAKSSRQHRFPWLMGDTSPTTGRRVRLPVDGYWEDEHLVVEFAESQHTEATPHFDKPDVLTVSGVHRGIQRATYDERRRKLIPEHGLRLVTISATDFPLKRNRLDRNRDRDLEIVRSVFARDGFKFGEDRRPGRQVTSDQSRPVQTELRRFVAERDWDQFHTPGNLAKSISIEAGELLECFQWDEAADMTSVIGELADVLTYCYLLADKLGVEADDIVRQKLEQTRLKYPADRSRGRSVKYDQL